MKHKRICPYRKWKRNWSIVTPETHPEMAAALQKTEREILDEKAALKEQAEALAHALGCVAARDRANAKAEEAINLWPGLK